MRLLIGPTTACVILLSVAHAHADQLENVSPGLMCESETALAKLTLPDGSSKLDRPGPTRWDDIAVGNEGRCKTAPLHIRVNLVSRRINTSVVTYDTDDSRGPITYYVANKAFQPPTGPSPCFAIDAEVTLRGKVTIIASKDRHTGTPYTYVVLHGEKPYCIQPSLDSATVSPSRDVDLMATSGDDKQQALRKVNGQTVTVAGKITNANNGELMLTDARLAP